MVLKKTTKRKPAKKIAKKTTKRTTTKKKAAFGGYKVCFKGYNDSLEHVFGKTPIAPSLMTKKLWAYVKKKKLANNN
ncbi:MAG: hypothetical protein HN337_05545 [Deltaproteobacteria bacterium]|jgi:hypothetical protein|nr:hypothetical protein [Deltaproteobacteria bacterium]